MYMYVFVYLSLQINKEMNATLSREWPSNRDRREGERERAREKERGERGWMEENKKLIAREEWSLIVVERPRYVCL